jgi:hypothetical protein
LRSGSALATHAVDALAAGSARRGSRAARGSRRTPRASGRGRALEGEGLLAEELVGDAEEDRALGVLERGDLLARGRQDFLRRALEVQHLAICSAVSPRAPAHVISSAIAMLAGEKTRLPGVPRRRA